MEGKKNQRVQENFPEWKDVCQLKEPTKYSSYSIKIDPNNVCCEMSEPWTNSKLHLQREKSYKRIQNHNGLLNN